MFMSRCYIYVMALCLCLGYSQPHTTVLCVLLQLNNATSAPVMMKNLMLSLSLYVMTVGLCYDWICLYLCYFSIDLTVFMFPLSV